MDSRLGLVLTGGGARGAYQAGVLLALAEQTGARELPFRVLAGASAGSISAAFLAARARDFGAATRELFDLWGTIRPDDVFRTDAAALTRTGLEWVAELGLGAWIGTGRGRSLLDSAPLREYLGAHLDAGALRTNVLAGLVHGIGLTATNYGAGTAVTFFDGHADVAPWTRITRVAKRATLTVEHVMASSAIPMFFPAVELEGEFYADGCIRLNTPLAPAIHLGADRVLAIGLRHPRESGTSAPEPVPSPRYPTTAETAGVLLNALFLDALESDIERMQRINQTVQLIPPEIVTAHHYPLRRIPVMALRPSQDLGAITTQAFDRLPFMVRHLLAGLGASDRSGWDLVSYLAFDGAYTTRLLELGYEDAMAQRDALAAFLA